MRTIAYTDMQSCVHSIFHFQVASYMCSDSNALVPNVPNVHDVIWRLQAHRCCLFDPLEDVPEEHKDKDEKPKDDDRDGSRGASGCWKVMGVLHLSH